jgi:hypothetical protein
MGRAKALIEVVAGVIPDSPMSEYTKRWSYTDDEHEQDQKVPPDQPTIFSQRLQEAHT